MGTTTGRCGNEPSTSSSAAWLTRQAVPPSTAANGAGGSSCASARANVTPDGATQMVRTRGAVPRSARTRPRRPLAASNASSAGTSPKRCTSAAASTAGSDRRGSSRSPENGAGRRRPRERRARAAQASEPRPSASSSGRWSGAPAGRPVAWPLAWWSRRRLVGQAQPPARPHLIGVDEALAAAHVVAEVEGGDLHPVGAVAETVLRDLPQALAGAHGVRRALVVDGRRRDDRRRRRAGARRTGRWAHRHS